MSSFGRKIYPEKDRLTFDGGLNTKYERSIIQDAESPDCLNVTFNNGAVQTRYGFSKLNTASVGTFACDGLYTRHDQTTAQTMIAFFGTRAHQWTGSTFSTIPSATSVFTAGIRIGSAEYQNHIFFGNGGTVPYKWNGTNFTRHGVYPPTQTATVASQATGVLTGDYRYKYSTVNSQSVESDVGPISVTFTAASGTLRVSALQTFAASYGVNARRLYRNSIAAPSTYKRVAEIANNTATTYDDNIADASLGVVAPTDNGVPPNWSFCIYHANRLFMNDANNPNYVWYTELGEPYTVASTNFRKIGDNTSDLVRGLGVWENSVYVYCDNSAALIYMPDTDDANWVDVKVKGAYGSKSPFGVFNFLNKQMFPAIQNTKFSGFGVVAGNTMLPSSTLLSVSSAGSDLESDRIEPDMFNINESAVGRISSVVFKNKAWISVPYGTSQTTNNRVYIFDFSIATLNKLKKPAWIPFDGFAAEQFTIYSGNLYFGTSASTGYVYMAESGLYSDDGSAIDSYFWTKEFGGEKGHFNFQKDFRYAKILNENSGDWFMDVGYRVNSDLGDGNTKQVNLDPGGSLWGTMVWGRDMWGGGTAQAENRIYLDGARGERIQFKFSNQNTVNQAFKVHGLNFMYNLKGFR
jgi:hypothetical protein